MKPSTLNKLRRTLRATLHEQLDDLLNSDAQGGGTVLQSCVTRAQQGGVVFRVSVETRAAEEPDAGGRQH